MLELSEFKNCIDKSQFPIVIAKPIYIDNDITDFKILYFNETFSSKFSSLLDIGNLYSEVKDKISLQLSFIDFAKEALTTGETKCDTFYSTTYSCWLKITMNATINNNLFFSLIDITQEKEREQQLKRQNLRLAALTDELSLSRENLKNKLENIENLNEELSYIAYHDTLTGLYNKQQLFNDLAKYKKEYTSKNEKFGIILIDLDNMKYINDSEGHSVGDEFICKAAHLLKSFERKHLKCYRFGGDEFIILGKNIASKDTLLNIGDAILEIFNSEGIEFSAGIAVFPDDTIEIEELLKFSDMAMYEVKKKGRNNVCFFQNVMQEKFLKKLNIQNRISDAILNNDFKLYYQPQFDVATNELRGFEALLRWHDEKLGWINPEQFISIAEETRLIIELGDWVLSTALQTLQGWVEKYNFDGIMSINVSPIQLKKTDFIFNLKEKINKYNINTKNLELEITEGVLIDNKEETVLLLRQIRNMGIGISLDDFGTGYSSLNYLQMLPITTLKIDKSFIANITSDNGVEANITDSIVSMVSKMGLDTIAEGVENSEQLKILKKINCKTIQGFLKGKPMTLERCNKMLAGDKSAILTIENDA